VNSATERVIVSPVQVLTAMKELLDSTQYACRGTSIEDISLVFKMFPKKVVNLVAEQKGWKLDEVPFRMVRRIRTVAKDDMGDMDESGFCLDYERRTIVKYVLGSLADMCISCHRTEQDAGKLKVCSKCLVVRYCCHACQLRDWQQHKKTCLDLKEEYERGILAVDPRVLSQIWEW